MALSNGAVAAQTSATNKTTSNEITYVAIAITISYHLQLQR